MSQSNYYQQPPSGYAVPAGRPSTQLGWAIAAVITFWPLAIPAFIYSFRVDPAWRAGDQYGAQSASRSARICGVIAVVIGVVSWLAIAALLLLTMAVGPNMSSS